MAQEKWFFFYGKNCFRGLVKNFFGGLLSGNRIPRMAQETGS